jgi:hypothetical protein
MSFELSFQRSFDASFRRSFEVSDGRSDGLSFGVSYALSGEMSFGLSFRLSSEMSFPRSFQMSFPASFPVSFLRSSKEIAERGTGSGSALVVQSCGGGMRSMNAEERGTKNQEPRTKNEERAQPLARTWKMSPSFTISSLPARRTRFCAFARFMQRTVMKLLCEIISARMNVSARRV